MKTNSDQLRLFTLPPAQSEMLVCQLCGYTWKSENTQVIINSWKALHPNGIRGPLCDCCWTLHTVLNLARVRKISLKRALGNFLKGIAKRERKQPLEIWKEKTK